MLFCMRLSLAGFIAVTTVFTTLSVRPTAVAAQSSRWKEIGKTSAGNFVYIDPKSVKKVNGIVSARLRVKFVKPVVDGKNTWAVSHHSAMFDCAKKAVAAKESIYYSDEAATKEVRRQTIAQPGYGPALGGSMAQVALDYVCKS